MGYPPEYDKAWDAMIAKGTYWGLAPIHHGCFENGWKGALEAAARIVEQGGNADDIRALAVWTEEDESNG